MEPTTEVAPLRVKGDTDPAKLARTIALTLIDHTHLKVRAMGPASVNQAVKGLILARQFLTPTARDFTIVPGFATHREGEDEITVIVFGLTLFNS